MAPKGKSSELGDEAVALAAGAGLELDDWQAHALRLSLAVDSDKWAATEVGLVLPRQNGKDAVLEARELAGLFLVKEPLIIHSAHQFKTSLEHFRRLEFLILNTPELETKVKRISRSHGEEGIEIKGGPRIQFSTRTKAGGRGLSADCLILNEAMILPEAAFGALFYTLSGKSQIGNPQIWYAGSAVDQMIYEHGAVLSRLRERALRREPRLMYLEWSIELENPDLVDNELASDRKQWRRANPALGIRISEEHVDAERRSTDPRTFAVERLGVGDWPPTSMKSVVIDLEKWEKLTDVNSKIEDQLVFAFDVKPDRSASSICVAGRRLDSRNHVEVVERRRSTNWVADRLQELSALHSPAAILCDAAGPAASLVTALEAAGLEVMEVSAKENAHACGFFYDAVEQENLRHLGTPELLAALRGAAKRPLGDAWAWSRKNSAVDISPLVACTLALWGSAVAKKPEVFALTW